MHIFLTGTVQIGKTTVIDKTLALLGVTAGGFRSYFGADRHCPSHHYLYMSSAAHGMMRHAVLPRFEELGLQYLAQASAYPLIILDECGRLEQRFPRFCAQVLELLEGETPVLGAVRQDVMGWLEEIRHHPKVQLVTVTEQNRNELPQQLAAYYRTLLK